MDFVWAVQRPGAAKNPCISPLARGLKAGEFLLEKVIERARQMGARELYLLTNSKCEAAIHLYEKLGFVHDKGVMERHGGDYCRCDVAMRFGGW